MECPLGKLSGSKWVREVSPAPESGDIPSHFKKPLRTDRNIRIFRFAKKLAISGCQTHQFALFESFPPV
jgi:hypothetical protein